MKVLPVNTHNYYNNCKQNFKSVYKPYILRGRYLNDYGDAIVNSHETYTFRNDINWSTFGKYINTRFSGYPKVSTYIYGCSDGSEPYSLSSLLQTGVSNPERFYPIIAVDVDGYIIEENIKRKNPSKNLNTTYPDNVDIYKYLGIGSGAYFGTDALYRYSFDEQITEPVEFRCANILEDINQIDFTNPTLFMCRNMWPYIEPEEYDKFAQSLYKKLPKGSSVIIGSFDYKGNKYLNTNKFPESLIKAGFKLSDDNISRDILIRNLAFEK